jgi:4-oxalocrotonate tautomerase
MKRVKDALHKSPRRVYLRTRAVCGVANPRHSVGYGCGLRLAAHPDPQHPLTARLMQGIPSPLILSGVITMPFAQIYLLEGRTEEQKRAVIAKVTAALQEALSAPKESIRVCIHDMPKENWGIAGVTAKDLGR